MAYKCAIIDDGNCVLVSWISSYSTRLSEQVTSWFSSKVVRGLIANPFTHSLANRLCLRQNYNYLHRFNNCKCCGSVACVPFQNFRKQSMALIDLQLILLVTSRSFLSVFGMLTLASKLWSLSYSCIAVRAKVKLCVHININRHLCGTLGFQFSLPCFVTN